MMEKILNKQEFSNLGSGPSLVRSDPVENKKAYLRMMRDAWLSAKQFSSIRNPRDVVFSAIDFHNNVGRFDEYFDFYSKNLESTIAALANGEVSKLGKIYSYLVSNILAAKKNGMMIY